MCKVQNQISSKMLTTVLLMFPLCWLIAEPSYAALHREEHSEVLNITAGKLFHHYTLEFPEARNHYVEKSLRILGHSPAEPKTQRSHVITRNESIDKLSGILNYSQHRPVVVLVEETATAFKEAFYFTGKLLDKPDIRSEFWLMKFNTSGVTSVTAQSRVNSTEFQRQLQEGVSKQYDESSHGSTAFFAILKATQILPQNTSILIFTHKKSVDEDLSQLALANLKQKHIQLFVVWTGSYPTKGNEERLLSETAFLTGGFFSIGSTKGESQNEEITSALFNEISKNSEILLAKTNLNEDGIFQLPLDRTVKEINIIINGYFTDASLTNPKGYTVDLLSVASVRRLSAGASVTVDATDAHAPRTAHVRLDIEKLTTLAVGAGVWELRIGRRIHYEHGYNLMVYAKTNLTVKLSQSTESTKTSNHSKQTSIQLQINGEITKINNITLLDNNGLELKTVLYNNGDKMNMMYDINSPLQTGNTRQISLSDVNTTLLQDSFYVKVIGTNSKGELFSRLSYVNRDLQSRKLPSLIIETSTHSELLATPGSRPKIIFQVTNNRDQTVFVPFACTDEKSLLKDLQPRGTFIGPKQTVDVTVLLQIPVTTTLSFTNLVTLRAQGQEEQNYKSAMVYVSNQRMIDTEMPYLNYKFTSNCMEVSYSSCQSGTWTLEVVAQDSQSGLLQVTSNPFGLYTPNGYISGTKESVTSFYSSTCCQPYLEITAVDLNNNRRSYKTDAYHATLSTGSIVAIVLGVILLLVIIIVVAVLIRRKYTQRDSLDLPRYRSQAASTTRF